MSKFERKFGKYAIKNLSLILIICYALGYIISMVPNFRPLLEYLTLNPIAIMHGQVWRLVTWLLIPPYTFSITTIITLFFYYSIGKSLERAWGDYLYNIYIFSGLLFTIIGSVILTFMVYINRGNATLYHDMQNISYYFSTYYVNMSIFLAFALTFPEVRVLLMFIIPVKVKWLGFLYAGLLIYEFLASNLYVKVIILMSILNFIVFYCIQRFTKYGSPRMRFQSAKRRHEYNKDIRREARPNGISKHKCAICGRTDDSNPELTFRFCSKCNGNYEYCEDHLFSHKHIE